MKKQLPLVILLFIGHFLFGQINSTIQMPTSINEDGSPPDDSAILDVNSASKGVLVPRMTQAQRDMIVAPATGLLIFQIDNQRFSFFNGTNWEDLANSTIAELSDVGINAPSQGNLLQWEETLQKWINTDFCSIGQYYYSDLDGDGFGDSTSPIFVLNNCPLLSDMVTNDSDCDDGNISIHPNATEVCDGIDNNCNGLIDEELVLYQTCDDGNDCTFNDLFQGSCTCIGIPYSCDDGIPCTDDICNGDGNCFNVVSSGYCFIAGSCYTDGAEHPSSPCLICDGIANPNGWSYRANGIPCDDGLDCTIDDQCQNGVCAGTPYSCDDGLDCTTDSCDGNGGCINMVNSGFCLINGSCIADEEKPIPFCLNGLSVPLNENGNVTISAIALLEFATDNCSIVEYVEGSVKMRKEGDSAIPQSTITIDCGGLGTNILEIWVYDDAGNSNYCTTYIVVQDPCTVCDHGSDSFDVPTQDTTSTEKTPNVNTGQFKNK